MKSEIIKHDFTKLDAFVKGLNTNMVVAVGIFGNKTSRTKTAQTNAEIGFKHEFGKGVPMRSFLRMPIFQYSEQILGQVKKAGALRKLADGRFIQVLADLGIACEATILQAFASAGWGDWAPNAPSTIRRKKSSQPLIDSGQLRKSISSAVVNA